MRQTVPISVKLFLRLLTALASATDSSSAAREFV